jgi:biotin carboxylase
MAFSLFYRVNVLQLFYDKSTVFVEKYLQNLRHISTSFIVNLL